MTDVLSAQSRSKNMRAIRHRDTAIEQKLAEMLDRLAPGYRTQAEDLPGKPDFVIDDRQAAILVHGCFWHHHDCHLFKIPSTRTDFWLNKIAQNVARDKRTLQEITAAGWRVLIVWECALRGRDRLAAQGCQERLEEWLCAGEGHAEITTRGIGQKTDIF